MDKKLFQHKKDEFLLVVSNAADGDDKTTIYAKHPHDKELVDLHYTMIEQDSSYKDIFNQYSEVTHSRAAKDVCDKVEKVNQKDTTKTELQAIWSAVAHLPTMTKFYLLERKIAGRFKENYQLKP